MPGTLVITTLSDGTNSTSATNPIQGSAKVWANWDGLSGASPVIKSSYNVSSITRTNTGKYTIAFTNALTDANYATTYGYVAPDTSGVNSGMCLEGTNTSLIGKTSSQVQMVVGLQTGNTYLDKIDLSVAIFR
jgi:hypothetical protein